MFTSARQRTAELVKARACAQGLDDRVQATGHVSLQSTVFCSTGGTSEVDRPGDGPEAATRLSATRTRATATRSQRQISGPCPAENTALVQRALSPTSVAGPGRRPLRSLVSIGSVLQTQSDFLDFRICF